MSSEEEPKVVKEYDDAPIIEEWVLDDEEEDVSQPKTEKKIVRPSIVKKEFVKSKQQQKTARKTGNPKMDLQDQGVIDGGCSRHMTGNTSYLTNYEEIDGGYVAFSGNPKGGKITGKVPRPNDPIESVVDEVVYKELGDSLVRAATTASSLEAEQDSGGGPRFQETIGDTIAQTRFKNVSKHSNDSLLARGNTLRSDEDRLKLDKLTALSRVESSDNEESLGEDASKQGRIDAINADEEITLVSVHDEMEVDEEVVEVINIAKLIIDAAQDSVAGDIVSTASAATIVSTATTTIAIRTVDDITLAQALEEMKSTKPKKKRVVIQELGESTTTKSSQLSSSDKGK
ncbi:hypothetical protein Tco_1387418 [Tanacetum coccineum]